MTLVARLPSFASPCDAKDPYRAGEPVVERAITVLAVERNGLVWCEAEPGDRGYVHASRFIHEATP